MPKTISLVFAVFTRRPLAWIGGAFVLFWVVYVGSVLRPRLVLPPLDRSRPLLASWGDRTTLIQAASDGQIHTISKTIGPVTLWKKGLVYWDSTKPCLVYIAPGQQKARTIWLHPSFHKLKVLTLMPAPDGVYLNVDSQIGFGVLHVHLPDGAAKIMPKINSLQSSETSASYAAFQKNKNVVVVHYATGKTRTVSVAQNNYISAWDYDPARDAVMWLQSDTVCYNSPARSWSKTLSAAYSVGYDPASGDVWVQSGGGSDGGGMFVLTANGVERGWRWRGETYPGNQIAELAPEQEKLVRALLGHKEKSKP